MGNNGDNEMTINLGDYRVRRADSLNIICEKFHEGGDVIKVGKSKGDLTKAQWKMIGGFHSTWQSALYFILDKIAFDDAENLSDVLKKQLALESLIKNMEITR